PALPVRELAGEPQVALLERQGIGGAGLLGRPLVIAGPARRLRARGPDVAEALEVTAGNRELERLAEGLARAGIAPSRAHAPERDQRVDAADRVVQLRLREHVLCRRGGVVPAPGVALHEREPGVRVVRPEVVLVGPRDVLAEIPLGTVELVHLSQAAPEVDKRRADPDPPMLSGDRQALPEVFDPGVYRSARHVRGADQAERPSERLEVVELLGERGRPLPPGDALVGVAH